MIIKMNPPEEYIAVCKSLGLPENHPDMIFLLESIMSIVSNFQYNVNDDQEDYIAVTNILKKHRHTGVSHTASMLLNACLSYLAPVLYDNGVLGRTPFIKSLKNDVMVVHFLDNQMK